MRILPIITQVIALIYICYTSATNCDSKYAKETSSTKECICLSRNCGGPLCQSSQGFVWYNYVKCPTCQCLPPLKRDSIKSSNDNKQESTKSETFHSTKLKDNIDTDDQNTAKNAVDKDEEIPSTWTEWLIDNSSLITVIVVAIMFGSVVFIFVYLSVFVVPSEKSPRNSTISIDSTDKSDTVIQSISPRDSVIVDKNEISRTISKSTDSTKNKID